MLNAAIYGVSHFVDLQQIWHGNSSNALFKTFLILSEKLIIKGTCILEATQCRTVMFWERLCLRWGKIYANFLEP